MAPGEYAYRIGESAHPISVADHRSSPQEQPQQRGGPLLITVKGEKVDVPHAKLVAGPSAIWLIEKGENLSIQAITEA
jgi:hypothetical protein